MLKNHLNSQRRGASFESFKPVVPEQEVVAGKFLQLAESVIKARALFAPDRTEVPPSGRFIFLHGEPGRGKTHLLKAFANHVIAGAPELESVMFWANGDLGYYTANTTTGEGVFNGAHIAVFDDMFVQYRSQRDVDPYDIQQLSKVVMDAYERHALIVVNSNFPLVPHITDRIRANDPVGRVTSRLEEMMAGSAQIEIPGPDYRTIIANRMASGDAFGAFEP